LEKEWDLKQLKKQKKMENEILQTSGVDIRMKSFLFFLFFYFFKFVFII
jgi:hypothetical protein